MQSAPSIPHDQLNRIEDRLTNLEKIMGQLVEKIEEITEPPEGSKAWWRWAIKAGEDVMKNGDYVTLRTNEELQKYLTSLK
jgi:hypothetical protein